MKKESYDKAKWMPVFILGVLLMIVYYALGNLDIITGAIGQFFSFISPLLYGILFTYFLYKPHSFLERKLSKVRIKKFVFISERARGISTILVFFLLIALVSFVLSFLLPVIFKNVVDLVNNIPMYFQAILDFFDNLPDDSLFGGFDVIAMLQENLGIILNTVVTSENIEMIATGAVSFAGGIFNVLLGLALSLYILLDKGKIKNYFIRLNRAVFKNEKKRDSVARYFTLVNNVLLTFIASKGLDSLINFTVVTTLLLSFRVEYAVLLGMVAGLFNFIPYVGSIIATVIISILALLTCELPIAIAVSLCLLVFQQLDGNFIEPKIMNTSLKINPILVIMAVVIGGAYFGIAGMFLGVPITVIIMQILQEFISSSETVAESDDSRR